MLHVVNYRMDGLIKIMKNNLVSIITPAYNSERTIEETIQSVLAQTYDNWEMIIVDDCSLDETLTIVKKFLEKDARIVLVELDENSGVASARNAGIKRASGRYIAFLDSNDLWNPDKLKRQIGFMKEEGCYFSYTAYEIIDVDGRDLGKVVTVPLHQNYRNLVKMNAIGCLTVMIDIEEIEDIEMPLLKHEDFALWLTILRRGYVAHGLNENLAKYRKHDDSLSFNKIKTPGGVWRVYRKNQNISVVLSSIYLFHFITRTLIKYKKLGRLQEVVGFKKRSG